MKTPSKKILHSTLMERLKLAGDVRRRYEPDWKLNLAYINGEQHIYWDLSSRAIKQVEYPAFTPVITRNVMGKIQQIGKSRLLKADPVPMVLPMTADNRDKIVADICAAALKQWSREDDGDERIRDMADWQLATGNGFFKTYWDSLDKKPRVSVVSPFEISADPHAKLFGDIRWIIHTQFLDPDLVRVLYPDVPPKLLTATRRDSENSVDVSRFTGGAKTGGEISGIVVHEYWEKPWPGCEEGRLIIFTESGVIKEGPFPYNHKTLPFSHAGHVKRTDSIWHRAHHDFLRPLQDEVNRAEQQIVQNRALANGKWGIPAEIEMEEMPDGNPRQILRWSGQTGVAPIQFPGVRFDQWVGGEPDRLAYAMGDLAGQHEVSNGAVPGRVEAASAIQLLMEQDDSIMQEARRSLEQAIAHSATMQLQLFKQYGDATSQVKAYNKDGRLELHEFKKDEIQLDQRVVVRSTTGLPSSPSGRREMVKELLGMQLIDQNHALEMLQIMPEELDLLSDQADRNKAVRENQRFRLVKGEVDPNNPIVAWPLEWDNHAVHQKIHSDFTKSEEFEALPDEAKLAFEFHMDMHEQWIEYLSGVEAKKQQILMGQIPGPPKPNQLAQDPSETEAAQIPIQGGAPPDVVPPSQSPGLSLPASPEFQSPNQQSGAPTAPSSPLTQ